MKKALAFLLIISTMLTLSSCFLFGRVTTYPDMVEYTEAEVLEVAKEKYQIVRWVFTSEEIMGDASYDEEGEFCLTFFDEGRFSTEPTGGDNIEAAFTSFAGKNGNHDIQGRYSIFL